MKTVPLPALGLALAAAFPPATLAQSLRPVVVTAPVMSAPLEVSFDPRAPQQPVPAPDGASLLKTIPGMSVIRKGGTGGDPMFRGMAASRLNILLDGEQILGGCGMRMDPPTAYVFPDSYDKVTLLKGPQSVLYGPGASSGTVLFERKPMLYVAPGASVDGALTVGSFGRHDELVDVKGGNAAAYVRGIVTHASSRNYRDGAGNTVHSRYERRSGTLVAGLTPDTDTRVELSAIRSAGEAAYADRGMDGSKFDRENLGLKFEKARIGGLIDKVEGQAYYNYIDHVMDNFSLRTFARSAMMMNPMASNPDRKTTGARVAVTLAPGEETRVVLGADQQTNVHTARASGGGGEFVSSYRAQPRTEDARFRNVGLFGEVTRYLGEDRRLIAGLRGDRWKAEDQRQKISGAPNPTRDQSREEVLGSGFVRYEWDLGPASTAYAGIGHSRRAPDYWELIGKEAFGQDTPASLSGFDKLQPEKNTQLDLGVNWKSGPVQGFVSGFYGRVDDYILIQSNYSKPSLRGMGSRSVTIARNVSATTYGGEAGVNYAVTPAWKAMASLAYVRGENDTDHRPLGQMPALEARLGLDWDSGPWFAGSLLRLAARQDRVAIHQGNIVGQDLGPSGGFGVFSINGGYRWSKQARIAFGVDNLFDKTYAEAISRSGSFTLPGNEVTGRVNEPGRTFWLKAQFALN